MDIRLNLISDWLKNQLNLKINDLSPASADASFRRYFRAQTPQGSLIIMDAPPEKESITGFIEIAQALSSIGVHTPEVKAKDIQQGFLLLEDLGNVTYLEKLLSNSNNLYSDAIDSLILIQKGEQQSTLDIPQYDAEKLEQEMDLFDTWFIKKHLKLDTDKNMQNSWTDCKTHLIDACLKQPQTWVHRDYHSRNLMVTKTNSPGIIDFQDMVKGPFTYDLASIFKDCYIEWSREKQLSWLEEYRLKAQQESMFDSEPFSPEQLTQWFDLTGLQRHLKVLGIFCRLYYRDGKDQYLNDLPLVAKYVLETLSLYPQLSSFREHYSDAIKLALTAKQ